jgi:hypothetical protein
MHPLWILFLLLWLWSSLLLCSLLDLTSLEFDDVFLLCWFFYL